MTDQRAKLEEFVEKVKQLEGYEKGEAQMFCDWLFQAFGHDGVIQANAKLEFRIKQKNSKKTIFADLVWKPRLLLEMKSRGTNLSEHYSQALDYWINAVPDRPRYVVLCNFEEFWIYDFDVQVSEPVDKISIQELPERYSAMNFMFPEPKNEPTFKNDYRGLTIDSAKVVGQLYRSICERGCDKSHSKLFVLQLLIAMFSEHVGLLPKDTISNLVADCLHKDHCSYDLFWALFNQMNTQDIESGGRFKTVPYFNGGIFKKIYPLELNNHELELIGGEDGVARRDWSKINPSIFGIIFQQSMGESERHRQGAHYTSENEIIQVINPTIIQPWDEQISKANTKDKLLDVRKKMMEFKVLDPACGSGNFLYMAYRAMVKLEIKLMLKLKEKMSEVRFDKKQSTLISPKQFYGFDIDPFGVELAKVTLMIAKKLARDEAFHEFSKAQLELSLEDDSLPLDNLDDNIKCEDALFADWPKIDSIIGNPPFQSVAKMPREFSLQYINSVRKEFPEVPGRVDYCVYWFHKAHNHLRQGQRAGLIGTNTIRIGDSRVGGLDHIVNNSGTITEAVSNQVWLGDASVHISIVNWKKGESSDKKILIEQMGNTVKSEKRRKEVDFIGPSLSFNTDISKANQINSNTKPKVCFQGQTHGNSGFLMEKETAISIIKKHPSTSKYLHPFLITKEMVGNIDSLPDRFVIDFGNVDMLTAKNCQPLFSILEKSVLPIRESNAKKQRKENENARQSDPKARVNTHHIKFHKYWWQLSYPRLDLLSNISSLKRYLACGRVATNQIFEFVSPNIRPADSLIVYTLEDDYSFGVLQSEVHCNWFFEQGAKLGNAPNYASKITSKTFPWPQNPDIDAVRKIASASVKFRNYRQKLKESHGMSLRELHNTMKLPGKLKLRDLQDELNNAVRLAYGMKETDNLYKFLLNLNNEIVNKEKNGEQVTGPGLPSCVTDKSKFVSSDCLRMPAEIQKLLSRR